jgi:hypothetical protein
MRETTLLKKVNTEPQRPKARKEKQGQDEHPFEHKSA